MIEIEETAGKKIASKLLLPPYIKVLINHISRLYEPKNIEEIVIPPRSKGFPVSIQVPHHVN